MDKQEINRLISGYSRDLQRHLLLKGCYMAGNNGRFTATEKRIIDVLSDGLPHRREELHACLNDELGERVNLNMHISNIRKKIAGRGEDIVCQLKNRRIHFRHMRQLRYSAND